MTSSKPRDITFDIVKGIGILLVLIGHVWEMPNGIRQTISSFHMPMFFIVAGYFSRSYSEIDNCWRTIRSYAKRLIPPFVFTIFISFLFFIALGFFKHEWNPAITKILSILWADVTHLKSPWGEVYIGVIWFLLALFWAKVFFLFLSKWEHLVLPISLLISMGALIFHKVLPTTPWCILLGFTALPFVTIGWWIKRYTIPMWLKIGTVVLWVLAIRFSQLDMYCFTWGNYPIDVLGACGGTIVLYWISSQIKEHLRLSANILARLGVWSLAIMCFHDFEIATHLGNRIQVQLGLELPLWAWYIWRYTLTIALAVVVIHIPKIKKIFL